MSETPRTLEERITHYLRQLAPHIAEREAAKLLEEALRALRDAAADDKALAEANQLLQDNMSIAETLRYKAERDLAAARAENEALREALHDVVLKCDHTLLGTPYDLVRRFSSDWFEAVAGIQSVARAALARDKPPKKGAKPEGPPNRVDSLLGRIQEPPR